MTMQRMAGQRIGTGGALRRWLALAAMGALAACAPGAGEPPDMLREAAAAERAFREAFVILPGQDRPQRLSSAAGLTRAQGGAPVPVVVFAHGCGGFDSDSAETFRLLAENGFAAIAPDHFARPDARLGCSGDGAPALAGRSGRRDAPLLRTNVLAPTAAPDTTYVGRRLDEISVALWRVREMPWVDRNQVFLVGHSLGRGTAGLWPVRDVAAAAVLGQDCTASPREMPLAPHLLPLADRRERAGTTASAAACADLAMRTGGAVIGPAEPRPTTSPEARAALLHFLRGG